MRLVFFLFCLLSFSVKGQAPRDINLKYWYSDEVPFTMVLKPSRTDNAWVTTFRMKLRDTTDQIGNYYIVWQVRNNLSEKEGMKVPGDSANIQKSDKNILTGEIEVPLSDQYKVLTARIMNNMKKKLWIYYCILEPKYPDYTNLLSNGLPVVTKYVNVGETVTVKDGSGVVVSYYNDNFPAASPPFSESVGRVSKGMNVDSTFTLPPGQALSLSKGLYLIQKDTSGTEGLAFRAEEDYPRLSKIQSLAGPLIYICTKQEYERIKLAKEDKRAFDKIILTITGDANRAKNFMKNYYRRVELANTYFTSYKEGWKTDRGMIYIVFGPPDEVFKFIDREVWNYSEDAKISFEFVKSPSIFDPENYVLIRNKKYTQTWYEVIDLWRNVRY